MDLKAFEKMSYGLYLVSTKQGKEISGCIVNTLVQATTDPIQMIVVIHKDNYTAQLVEQSGVFAAVALSQSATMELIGKFGLQTSQEVDKFKGLKTREDINGIPYVYEQAVARYSCKVVDQMDAGSHIVFLGEVVDSEVLGGMCPMTYSYYDKIKNGLTPPKASSYHKEPTSGYRCKICGYVLESKEIPECFECPVCGRGKEYLGRIEER